MLKFLLWNKESEAVDLQRIDIGIMPLPDDDWAKGKCGFKALQYMAMETPCVVSPVGVNTVIVDHGVNGYWASSDSDWLEYLSKLIKDPLTRKMMGAAGKKKVAEHYSKKSNAENFNKLFT
jgi:glycosyltransferase involved in cell wall biosynthesis